MWAALEFVAEPEHVHVVGDAQVGPHLALLDVCGTDDYHYFRAVAQLGQHPELAVRLETRENPACVVIVEELASEFEIKLVSELGDALLDVLGLDFQVFFVVETYVHIVGRFICFRSQGYGMRTRRSNGCISCTSQVLLP